jgi:hypothetical protein
MTHNDITKMTAVIVAAYLLCFVIKGDFEKATYRLQSEQVDQVSGICLCIFCLLHSDCNMSPFVL